MFGYVRGGGVGITGTGLGFAFHEDDQITFDCYVQKADSLISKRMQEIHCYFKNKSKSKSGLQLRMAMTANG